MRSRRAPLAASIAILAAGCAAAPVSPPATVIDVGGCRVEVAERAPDGAVALGRVSVDAPADLPPRLVDEALAGRACGWGARALVRDGEEPLIPRGVVRTVVGPSVAEMVMVDAPSLDAGPRRYFARLYAPR